MTKKEDNLPFLLDQQGCPLLAALFRDASKEEEHTLLREVKHFASYLINKEANSRLPALRTERRCNRFQVNTLCSILVKDRLAKMVIDDISTSGIKGRVMHAFFDLINAENNYTISLKPLKAKRKDKSINLSEVNLPAHLIRLTHLNEKETSVSFEYEALNEEQYDGLDAFIKTYIND